MRAADDPQAFFDEHAEDLRAAALDGAPAAIGFIERFDDDIDRRVLYLFARRVIAADDGQAWDLDTCLAVGQAGVAEMLRQAGRAADDHVRRKCINLANAMSYNVATDAADCWPGDPVQRRREHFQMGLAAAEACIRWREELGNGDAALATAWWARGMHELSLGDFDAARASWTCSLDHARAAARERDASDAVGLDGDFGVILAWGYLGIAELCAGQPQGKARYEEAIAIFNGQCVDPQLEEDARFGIAQLETVSARYVR
jgi:tetratricopeptide (TPR) repeat protein